MERKIKRQKGLHRNIFHFSLTKELWFQYAIFVLGMSAVFDALGKVLGDQILAAAAIMLVTFVVIAVRGAREKKTEIVPYGPVRQFIGLYSIEEDKKIDVTVDNGMISRDDEIACIRRLVDQCFEEKQGRRGICLVGRSGSGKSTIINQFQYSNDILYTVRDFSGSYDYLEEYILLLYKHNPEENLTDQNKEIIILDHFERYFSLKEEKKEEVKSIIQRIAKLPVVFIFSMREEFFVSFLEEFDINNLDGGQPNEVAHKGILLFKEYLTGNRQTTEENVLICGNERENDREGRVPGTMKRLCEQAFGNERGREVYNHFENGALIEQQIIFSMMKRDFDIEGEIPILDSKIDESLMMKRYYDVQLCSTGDYYTASRIMYLLCVGRNSGIQFTDDDIKNALCIFENRDVEDYKKSLDKLHDLNLIKYSARNSTMRYEIAHDYVAKSYEAYANTELPVNVKNALDEFKSEYVRKTDMQRSISQYRKEKRWKQTGVFGWMIFSISMAVTLLLFGYNIKTGGIGVPWTVLVLCIASLVYVFSFYMNITRHYRKGGWIVVTALYAFSMSLGTAASVIPQFWLHCLGGGNAVLGLSCVIIGLNFKLAESARKWFRSYGLKTFVVGVLLIALACLVQFGTFETVWVIDTRSVLQFVPMMALLVYAYGAHVNKEFYYVGVEGIFSTGR